MTIIGIDPGLAACGFAVVEGGIIRDLGVWVSDAGSRLAERAAELRADLWASISERGQATMVVEAPSWPRDAGAAAKLGIAFGTITGLASGAGLGVEVVSASEWRARLGLPKRPRGPEGKAQRKADTAAAMAARWPSAGSWLASVPKARHEHAWDALAIATVSAIAHGATRQHTQEE